MSKTLDNDHKLQCTFRFTGKKYDEQYWYVCETCTPNTNRTGCCQACAAVCHKGHTLVARKGRFFCDCALNTAYNLPCQLYEEIVYPGSELPIIPIQHGFASHTLKKNHDEESLEFLKGELSDAWCTHFTMKTYDNGSTDVFIPWISKYPSQTWIDKTRNYSQSCSRSCESEPEGDIYVWSPKDKQYLLCGPVDEYKGNNMNVPVARRGMPSSPVDSAGPVAK